MRAADEDLRPARRAADLEDVGLDVLADPVVLDGRLLGRGEDRLDVVADVEDDRPRLDPVDGARDHLAFAAGELVEDLVALDLADPLEHDLLGGLGADPAEDVAVELFHLDEIADLGVGLVGAGVLEAELDERVLDLGDRGAGAEHPDLARLGVDPDVDVLVAGNPSVGRLDAVLDRVDQLLAGDLLLRVQLKEGTDEVSTHDAPPTRWFRIGPTIKKRGGHPRHGAAVQFRRSIHAGAWTLKRGSCVTRGRARGPAGGPSRRLDGPERPRLRPLVRPLVRLADQAAEEPMGARSPLAC